MQRCSSYLQATQNVGGKPAENTQGADGVDVTGASAMDGTEEEGETKPMED